MSYYGRGRAGRALQRSLGLLQLSLEGRRFVLQAFNLCVGFCAETTNISVYLLMVLLVLSGEGGGFGGEIGVELDNELLNAGLIELEGGEHGRPIRGRS